MAMKGYSAFPKNPASRKNLTIKWFSVIYPGHSLGGVLPFCRGAVGVFYSLSWLGNLTKVLDMTNTSDGEAPVLEFWWMWSTLSLPLLPGSPWLGVVVTVRVSSMYEVELLNHLKYLKLFNCVQTNNWYWIELLVLDNSTWNYLMYKNSIRNIWNHLTVCKQMSSNLSKNIIYKVHIFTKYIYFIIIIMSCW